MQNMTLCMRTWRKVRNFAWHRFARSDLAKLHKCWECAWSRPTRENFQFFVMYRSQANFYFSFFPAETLSNAWMLLC